MTVQLKEMNMTIFKSFLLHIIMTYLRVQFGLSKINCNKQNKK